MCQVPGCKNDGLSAEMREGIFCGVYLEDMIFLHCGQHTEQELQKAFEHYCEKQSEASQIMNPFVEVAKKQPGELTSTFDVLQSK